MVPYESTFYFTKNEIEMLMGIEYENSFWYISHFDNSNSINP